MIRVVRLQRHSTRRFAINSFSLQLLARAFVVVTLILGVIVMSSRGSGASSISVDRATAAVLYEQIQSIGSRVESLGQKYDLAQMNLRRSENQITRSKIIVAQIKRRVSDGNRQLRQDAIFAYVNNGATTRLNPIFAHGALDAEAINVYNQIAEGNINATLASLKYQKTKLTRERALLEGQVHRANSAARDAAKAFHDANVLHSSLERSLGQVKGRIATFIVQQEAAAASASAATLQSATLQSATPSQGEAAPPPNSRANTAIQAAMGLIGVPYVWGGATRSGVDCSGLVLLAYAAAGISLPHYSGSQFADTERVPLWNIQPGDLLFYGPNGSEHEAMYIGNGQMIEASSTGTLVHISPVRLGYGFVGLGRVRA